MKRQLVSYALGACLLVVVLVPEAVAVELPVRKAGLWEMKMLRTGGPAPEMTTGSLAAGSTGKWRRSAMAGGALVRARLLGRPGLPRSRGTVRRP